MLLAHETSSVAAASGEIEAATWGAQAGEARERGVAVEAVERVCRKLNDHLGRLIGAAGVRALLSRALVLAKPESPFLGAVRVGEDARLEGLREAIQDEEGRNAAAGLERILTNLLWLLVTFIGEDLTLRVVGQVWPDVPFSEPGPGEADGPLPEERR
jgi:hypothetical protein